MCYKDLEKPKNIILRDRKINIFLLFNMLYLFSLSLLATIFDIRAIFLLLVTIVLLFAVIKFIAKNNSLLKQLSSIAQNNLLNKTYTLKLRRPKIRLLAYPEVRRKYSPNMYYGLVITDSSKNKFYYFFNDCLKHDKDSINMIEGKFSGEISIQCFENTSIVKAIENDPHFLRIRYGEICD